MTEEELLKLKEEIELEKVKMQDQKREYKAYLRADARFEHLKDEMVKAIKESDISFENSYIEKDEPKTTCASLIISDVHYGLAYEDELNSFNTAIAVERFEELSRAAIKYCKLHKVKQLNIELLGDIINGYLHVGTRISNEEDVISQAMNVSKLIGIFINEIAMHIPEIVVYSCTGNHGRCTSNLKDSLQIENFERLITWYLQTAVMCENVIIKDCSTDMSVYKNMNGHMVAMMHGNLDKPNEVVDNFIKMNKFIPDEIHLGHTHSYKENDDYGINTLVNGSLCGMDSYSKSIRKMSPPTQVLRVYGEDVCTYKIKLF